MDVSPDRLAYLKYLLFCDHMSMHMCGCNQNAADRSCCWDHYKDTVGTDEYPEHFAKIQQRYLKFKYDRDQHKQLADITGDKYLEDNVIEWTEGWAEYYARRYLGLEATKPQLELIDSGIWYDPQDEIDYAEQQPDDS